MSNPWVAFQSLVEKSSTFVATIDSANGTRVTVSLLGGGTMIVNGSGTIGQKVLIKDGEIVSSIGSMTEFDMVLY